MAEEEEVLPAGGPVLGLGFGHKEKTVTKAMTAVQKSPAHGIFLFSGIRFSGGGAVPDGMICFGGEGGGSGCSITEALT